MKKNGFGAIHAATKESENSAIRLPICGQTNGHKGGRVFSSFPISEFMKTNELGQCAKCVKILKRMGKM